MRDDSSISVSKVEPAEASEEKKNPELIPELLKDGAAKAKPTELSKEEKYSRHIRKESEKRENKVKEEKRQADNYSESHLISGMLTMLALVRQDERVGRRFYFRHGFSLDLLLARHFSEFRQQLMSVVAVYKNLGDADANNVLLLEPEQLFSPLLPRLKQYAVCFEHALDPVTCDLDVQCELQVDDSPRNSLLLSAAMESKVSGGLQAVKFGFVDAMKVVMLFREWRLRYRQINVNASLKSDCDTLYAHVDAHYAACEKHMSSLMLLPQEVADVMQGHVSLVNKKLTSINEVRTVLAIPHVIDRYQHRITRLSRFFWQSFDRLLLRVSQFQMSPSLSAQLDCNTLLDDLIQVVKLYQSWFCEGCGSSGSKPLALSDVANYIMTFVLRDIDSRVPEVAAQQVPSLFKQPENVARGLALLAEHKDPSVDHSDWVAFLQFLYAITIKIFPLFDSFCFTGGTDLLLQLAESLPLSHGQCAELLRALENRFYQPQQIVFLLQNVYSRKRLTNRRLMLLSLVRPLTEQMRALMGTEHDSSPVRPLSPRFRSESVPNLVVGMGSRAATPLRVLTPQQSPRSPVAFISSILSSGVVAPLPTFLIPGLDHDAENEDITEFTHFHKHACETLGYFVFYGNRFSLKDRDTIISFLDMIRKIAKFNDCTHVAAFLSLSSSDYLMRVVQNIKTLISRVGRDKDYKQQALSLLVPNKVYRFIGLDFKLKNLRQFEPKAPRDHFILVVDQDDVKRYFLCLGYGPDAQFHQAVADLECAVQSDREFDQLRHDLLELVTGCHGEFGFFIVPPLNPGTWFRYRYPAIPAAFEPFLQWWQQGDDRYYTLSPQGEQCFYHRLLWQRKMKSLNRKFETNQRVQRLCDTLEPLFRMRLLVGLRQWKQFHLCLKNQRMALSLCFSKRLLRYWMKALLMEGVTLMNCSSVCLFWVNALHQAQTYGMRSVLQYPMCKEAVLSGYRLVMGFVFPGVKQVWLKACVHEASSLCCNVPDHYKEAVIASRGYRFWERRIMSDSSRFFNPAGRLPVFTLVERPVSSDLEASSLNEFSPLRSS